MPVEAVAVIVQVLGEVGAVNSPEAEMALQVSAQVTGADAVNCCAFNACRLIPAGVSVIGDVTVTVAEAGLPSNGVTVTVHVPMFSGAV